MRPNHDKIQLMINEEDYIVGTKQICITFLTVRVSNQYKKR